MKLFQSIIFSKVVFPKDQVDTKKCYSDPIANTILILVETVEKYLDTKNNSLHPFKM